MGKVENKKHQINIFCGNQSFIYRTDSLPEISKFMGLKKREKLASANVSIYLQNLHKELSTYDISGVIGGVPGPVKKKKGGKAKQAGLFPDFVEQLKNRLISMGAKTTAAQLKLLKKKIGRAPKSFKVMKDNEAQVALAELMRGEINGKRT